MHFTLSSLSTILLLSLSSTARADPAPVLAPRHVKPPGFVRVDIAKRAAALEARAANSTNAVVTLAQLGQELDGLMQVQAKKHKKKGTCKKAKHKKVKQTSQVAVVAAVAQTSSSSSEEQSKAAHTSPSTTSSSTSAEARAPEPTTTSATVAPVVAVAKVTPSSSSSSSWSSSSSSSAEAKSTGASQNPITSSVKGLISFHSTNCGASGATADQPNGSQDFLNCGVNGSGWTPPAGVTLDNVAFVSLEEALASNSVWEPCKQYVPLFEKYGNQLGIPPILLASLALQESTCNANTFGDNGGAIGLMQITSEKCGGQSHQACADPDYNIKTGATYFKSEYDLAGGNLLKALGTYNGWFPGMTYAAATAQMYGGCCVCQNNLDYLYQMLNGWMLGLTGYSMGSVGNLKACS